MKFPKMLRILIDDLYIQENFKRIGNFFRDDATARCNFYFLPVEIIGSGSNLAYPHNLNFTPKDVIMLSNSTNATVVFNYQNFDGQNIYLTSSGPTSLRLLLGRYE